MVQLYERVGGELSVSTASSNGATITSLPSGGFVVTWCDSHIKAQLFNAAGAKVGGEFLVNTGTVSTQLDPSITALSSGGFVVTWMDDSGDASSSGIKAQIFSAAGVKIGSEFVVNTTTLNYQSQPTIAALPSGGFVVSWVDQSGQGGDNSPSSLKAQIFNSGGAKVGSEFLVNTVTSNSQVEPTITALSSGGFVVSWTDYSTQGPYNDPYAIKAQIFDAGGTKVGAEFLVNATTSTTHQHPTITALSSGGFVVSWEEYSGPGWDTNGSAVKAQLFNAVGAKVGTEFLVNAVTTNSQQQPTITALSSGGFVVSWTDYGGQGVDISDSGIKAQVFDANGTKVGSEFLVNTETLNSQHEPSITSLPSGGFVVSWTDDQSHIVKAQIFAPSVGPTDISLSTNIVSETAVEGLTAAALSSAGGVNGTPTYTLVSDSSGGAFRIENDRLVIADNALLDFETHPQIALTIRATDSNGISYEEDFSLQINDVAIETRFSTGSEFLVNTETSDDQAQPTITALSSGGFVASWLSYSEYGIHDIKAQIFDPAGAKIGNEFFISTGTGLPQQPTITGLSSGGFLVSWLVYNGSDDSSQEIKAQIFNSVGAKVGGEFSVNTIAFGDQIDSTITALASGGFVMSWRDGSGQGGDIFDTGIKAQIFNASGTKIGGEFLVNTVTWGSQYRPTITALSSGSFVVSWMDDSGQGGDGSGFGIKAQIFSSAGAKVGGEFLVNTETLNTQWNPKVTALSSGGFVIAWRDSSNQGGDSSGFGIKAQIFDAEGTKVGGEFLVNTATLNNQFEPVISALPSGGFVVTWSDESGEGTDTSASGIKAQIFDSNGAKVGEEFVVNTVTSGSQQQPTIAPLLSGDLVVSWADFGGQGGDASGAGIKAKIFHLADDLIGTSGVDNLAGDAADNGIYGFAGNDTLTGAAGSDHLDGGTGADSMSGGADNDTYAVDNVGDTVAENFGEGTDTVETSLGVGANQAQRIANMYQLGANVENLTGTALNQGLEGNSLSNVITAGGGTDYVDASDGGNDSVNSGDGRDVIYYGAALTSADSNNGGDEGGDARGDLLVIQGDYTITLGADALVDIEKFRVLKGTNTAFGYTDGGTFDYNITTVDGNVAAGARLVVQGGSLQAGEHLIFNGAAESDGSFQIFGGHDADTLIGGAQGDHLLGRSGDDVLTGNGGADRLRGGLGGDTMNGGAGADIFVYAAQGGDEPYAVAALESTGLNYDTIVGFSFAEDKIDLPGSVSSLASVGSGALSDVSFDADLASAVDASLAANGAVLFTANNGGHSGETFLVVDADGNGSYQANLDFVIQLGAAVGTVPASPDFFM